MKGTKHVTIDEVLQRDHIDVCAGPMDLDIVSQELCHYKSLYSPNSMYVKVESAIPPLKPYVTVYIDRYSFEHGFKNNRSK